MSRTVVNTRLGSKVNSRWSTNPEPTHPSTGAHVLALTGITPQSLYRFDELSGNVLDRVGANNLAPGGSPLYQQQADDRRGIRYATPDSHTADVNDLGAGSGLYAAVFVPRQSSATLDAVIMRINAGGADGLACYMNVSPILYPTVLCRDVGANSLLLVPTTLDLISDRQPTLAIVQVDRAAATLRARFSRPGHLAAEVSGSIAGFATLTGPGQTFGFGRSIGGELTGGNTLSWAMVAVGAQCEGAAVPQNVARGLGWES